jgi:hypothetical protein
MEKGFAAPFGHTPPVPYETETMTVELLRISPPNAPEGYALNRGRYGRLGIG